MIKKNDLKILVVDDMPENLQVIAKTLENTGYEMRFAEEGTSALLMVKETSFDLILLDVMMPNMDGFEVCRHLKSDPTTASIPVIFITAKTDTASVVTGFAVGGVDYVTKPVQVDELRARVDTHLRLRMREQELRRLSATKDRFVSIVAHDLKTPLGGIQGFVSLLNKQFDDLSTVEIRESISLIGDAVENVTALIENLLSWSSLQVGAVTYNPSNFELSPVVVDVVNSFSGDLEHKQIEVSIKVPDDIWVYADIEMVEAVLRNLVSNGIKFGHRHGLIRLVALKQGKQVLFAVEDNGCGISEDNCSRLFMLDSSVKQTGTYGEIGTGMGLILSKEYVERHGGKIWLESQKDRGTKVYFTLPQANETKC
ncbi:hypothetical protein TI04_06005 [Achromatium sp. WMS2]|nr:hypothetical protein TI04_06005 [Achromatium sp. WMS2]